MMVCTVGGEIDRLLTAIKHWKPEKILFVPSEKSEHVVRERLMPQLVNSSFGYGNIETICVPNGYDLPGILRALEKLTPFVNNWNANGDNFQTVIEYTSGTNAMTAGIAIYASKWDCKFSYVSGAQRTGDGIGQVIPGHERLVSTDNPWTDRGYEATYNFVTLFDRHAYRHAADLAERTRNEIRDQDKKRHFQALRCFAQIYYHWDRFDHKSALERLCSLLKRKTDFEAALIARNPSRMLRDLTEHKNQLEQLARTTPPNHAYVLDILANAQRRWSEGRFDETVHRIYRAVEAAAQGVLFERYNIDITTAVPLETIPVLSLQKQWAPFARENQVLIALQQAYELLYCLDAPLGRRFRELGLDGIQSPLNHRNASILGHGFNVLKKSDSVDHLWKTTLTLLNVKPNELTHFPKFER